MELPLQHQNELRRLKLHFPFRFCFGAFRPNTNEFMMFTRRSNPIRKQRALAAKGFTIYSI